MTTRKTDAASFLGKDDLALCPYCEVGQLKKNFIWGGIECDKCEFKLSRADLSRAVSANQFNEVVKKKVAEMRGLEQREAVAVNALKNFKKPVRRKPKRKIRIK